MNEVNLKENEKGGLEITYRHLSEGVLWQRRKREMLCHQQGISRFFYTLGEITIFTC